MLGAAKESGGEDGVEGHGYELGGWAAAPPGSVGAKCLMQGSCCCVNGKGSRSDLLT